MDAYEYNTRIRIARELDEAGKSDAAAVVRPQGPNGAKHISSAPKDRKRIILLIWAERGGWQCAAGMWNFDDREWTSTDAEWWMELPWL